MSPKHMAGQTDRSDVRVSEPYCYTRLAVFGAKRCGKRNYSNEQQIEDRDLHGSSIGVRNKMELCVMNSPVEPKHVEGQHVVPKIWP